LKTLERVKGIEPSYSAWKAAALPLSYTRDFNSLSCFSTYRWHVSGTEIWAVSSGVSLVVQGIHDNGFDTMARARLRTTLDRAGDLQIRNLGERNGAAMKIFWFVNVSLSYYLLFEHQTYFLPLEMKVSLFRTL
jgi:hypothetical protein